MDCGSPRRSTCTPYIIACTLLKVKNYEGSSNKKAKKLEKIKQEYQKQRCANFKTCNQWTRSFFMNLGASCYAMDVLLNIKLKLLLMHDYFIQLVRRFFTIFDRYTIYCISILLHMFSTVLVKLVCHYFCILYDHLKYIHFCIICIQI